ncbi:glycosyltransferase involved in cell wall biosynthesis [Microbacterium sp. AG1240]|uniref:glycosyltransferase family 2 protein n=1 Tax=Microbacterium sp. AG1240 TaxID=2183992 RepID=UPI000EB28971|nr:glycosyltransferase [Microbacterium sp. AG1240]RKT36042.1 glycosyltransferase involved in cell wall biosynthesis [Microbacterium sp. AG1240]
MTSPLVSVIIPAYRAAEHLPAAVERLDRQTVEAPFEIIVVDDGSDDGTAQVAEQLAATYPRVRFFALPENGGVARARQRGVAEARGEFLWFVDADDTWPDDALRTLVALAQRNDADVVVADAEFVYRDGSRRRLSAPVSAPTSGREGFRMLLRGEITGHLWNKLFRRDVMAKASFAPARVQSDLVMVADALTHARRVTYSSPLVYQYLLRDDSIINSVSKRSDSLAIIDAAVSRDAAGLGLKASNDYRYFRARYIHLSGLKDALFAGYSPAERAILITERRRALTMQNMWAVARRRDLRRFALCITAKTSVRAHRALLALAER